MLTHVLRSSWLAWGIAVARILVLAGCWLALAWAAVANLGVSGRIAWFFEIPANFPTLVAAATGAGVLGIWLLGATKLRIAAMMLAAVVACGFLTAPHIPVSFEEADGDELKIMTWNVHVGSLDARAVANEVLAMRPDLVAFTEFSPSFRDAIGPILLEAYPYRLDSALPGHGGNGVYSRLPISDWNKMPERRPAATFRMELPNGEDCTVLLLHPDVPVRGGYARRTAFLQAVSAEVVEVGGPLIVLGDFNASWASADFREFCGTNDLFLASRQRQTWNAEFPWFLRTAIDHVLASRRNFSSISAQSGKSSLGGDHLPVMATLKVIDVKSKSSAE